MNVEALEYFFKGYFHQDWYAEYGTFQNAVQDFCENEAQSRVFEVKIALMELQKDESFTSKSIYNYGGYVRPEAFDLTVGDWVKQIVKAME
jgi:hypothetical protein